MKNQLVIIILAVYSRIPIRISLFFFGARIRNTLKKVRKNKKRVYNNVILPVKSDQGSGPEDGFLAAQQFTGRQVPQEPGQPVHVAGLLERLAHARHLFGRERQAALGLQKVGHGDGACRADTTAAGDATTAHAHAGRSRTLAERFHAASGRQAHAATVHVSGRQVRRHDATDLHTNYPRRKATRFRRARYWCVHVFITPPSRALWRSACRYVRNLYACIVHRRFLHSA